MLRGEMSADEKSQFDSIDSQLQEEEILFSCLKHINQLEDVMMFYPVKGRNRERQRERRNKGGDQEEKGLGAVCSPIDETVFRSEKNRSFFSIG